MNKNEIEKYTETEIQNGKTHQEIFNKIVSTSNFNIHDVATVVRKIPTIEKRKKYSGINTVLVGILALAIISRLITGLFEITQGHNDASVIVMFFPLATILLLYGTYKYKRNAHLATGLFMIFGALMATLRLINNFDIFALGDILFTIFGSILAFYLSSKLVGDYVLDQELKKTNPDQRENALIFTE